MLGIKRSCVLLVAVFCLSGCGPETVDHPPTVKVTGKVTLDDKPVAGAAVTFHPETKSDTTFSARATTKDDGTYELFTYFSASTDEAGAIPGKYIVTVTKTAAAPTPTAHSDVSTPPTPGKGEDSHGEGPGNELPSKYQSPTSSGINVEVKDGDNDIPIPLTSQ